jgi:hypothetical protein
MTIMHKIIELFPKLSEMKAMAMNHQYIIILLWEKSPATIQMIITSMPSEQT